MCSTYTLDDGTIEYLQQIDRTIKKRKEWNDTYYKITEDTLELALCAIQRKYFKATGYRLEETCRKLFRGVQAGGFETFIDFFNAFLFIRKLQYKLQYHKSYGIFPD